MFVYEAPPVSANVGITVGPGPSLGQISSGAAYQRRTIPPPFSSPVATDYPDIDAAAELLAQRDRNLRDKRLRSRRERAVTLGPLIMTFRALATIVKIERLT